MPCSSKALDIKTTPISIGETSFADESRLLMLNIHLSSAHERKGEGALDGASSMGALDGAGDGSPSQALHSGQ